MFYSPLAMTNASHNESTADTPDAKEFWQQWDAHAQERQRQIDDQLAALRAAQNKQIFGRTGHTPTAAGR